MPPGPFVDVAAGYFFNVGRRADGSLVGWGSNFSGQLNVPTPPPGLRYLQAAAGGELAAAVRSDGAVVVWGIERFIWRVPGVEYVRVSAGMVEGLIVGLRRDGGIDNIRGVNIVPALPPGVSYVDVVAGPSHIVARRSDGMVVAWGDNTFGQCDVPPLPPGLSYVQVSAGFGHSVARRSDGSVVVWGSNVYGEHRVRPLASGEAVVDVAAGGYSTAALYEVGGYSWFGDGCAGSAGTTELAAKSAPRIGETLVTILRPAPVHGAILLTGFSNTRTGLWSLPLDLGVAGMPGCRLRVSPDLLLPVGVPGSDVRLPLTDDPALVGFVLHQQALVLDPGANAFGAVMSAAASAVVGG